MGAIAQPGQWNVAGVNIPDFGLTEALGIGPANPNVVSGGSALYNSPYMGAQSTPSPYAGAYSSAGKVLGAQAPTGGSLNKASTPNISTPSSNTNQGPSINVQSPDYNAINNAYNSAYNSINQLRSDTMNGQQAFYNTFTDPYAALQPGINQALQTGTSNIQQARTQNEGQYQNVLDSAKNLYNQLSRSYTQQFGGANSAGAFGQALLGQQLQQGVGGAAQTLGQNNSNLNTQYNNLVNQYNTNTQQLKLATNAALNKAQTAFQQQLQYIDQLQNATDQQKAAANVGALQNYQQNVYNTQMQMESQAAALRQQALSGVQQLTSMAAMGQAYAGKQPDLNAYTQTQFSALNNIPAGGVNVQPSSNGTGTMVTGYSNPRYDQNGNPVY